MSQSFTKSDVGRGAMWSVVNQTVSQILVLVIFLVTARFIPKEIFGVMAVCYITVDIFRQAVTESIAMAINTQKSPTDEDYNAAFLIILIGGILSAAIIFIMAGPVANFMDNPLIKEAMQWMSLVLVTMGLNRTHMAWLTKHLRFKTLAICSSIAIVISGIVSVYLAIHGYFLISLIAQQLLISTIITISLWWITPWKPGFRTGRENVVRLLSYARHLMANACINIMNVHADTFFASYALGAAQTGVYNAAKRIIVAINMMMSGALGSVVLPTFASMTGDVERLRKNYLKGVSYSSMLTAPAYAGLAILSAEVIHIIMGEKWADVAPVLSIMCVSGYITTITHYNSNIIYTFQKPQWQTRIAAISAITNVVLFFNFAQQGLIPRAAAFTIKTVLLYPISAGCAMRLLKLPALEYIKTLLPSIVLSVLMGVIVWQLKLYIPDWPVWVRLPALAAAGGIVYLMLSLLFARKPLMEMGGIVKDIILKKS